MWYGLLNAKVVAVRDQAPEIELLNSPEVLKAIAVSKLKHCEFRPNISVVGLALSLVLLLGLFVVVVFTPQHSQAAYYKSSQITSQGVKGHELA